MQSIFQNQAREWHVRLSKCYSRYKQEDRDAGGTGKVSQAELARRINEKYASAEMPEVQQVSISRWLKIGSPGSDDTSFPPLKTVMMLADFFGVDVGYLIGETDYRTFEMEKACKFIGLSEEAAARIKLLTHDKKVFKITGMYPDEMGWALQSLLCSRFFFDLLMAFCELNRIYEGPDIQKQRFQELEQKYGSVLLSQALDFDPYGEGNPSQELLNAYKDVQDVIDKMYDHDRVKELSLDAAKYKLAQTFSSIIEELYPA